MSLRVSYHVKELRRVHPSRRVCGIVPVAEMWMHDMLYGFLEAVQASGLMFLLLLVLLSTEDPPFLLALRDFATRRLLNRLHSTLCTSHREVIAILQIVGSGA